MMSGATPVMMAVDTWNMGIRSRRKCESLRRGKKEQESKMNNKIALWTFIVGIISMLIGAIALLISHDMREIILPILGK